MKKLLVKLLLLLVAAQVYAQTDFRSLMDYNIQHYQQTDKLSYSIKLDLYKDSLSNVLQESEMMHVAKTASRQCVLTNDQLMIRENGLLVSVLTSQSTIVLQSSSESFDDQYMTQLEQLMDMWAELQIKEIKSPSSEIVFQVLFPAGMDYSAMNLHFDPKTRLLTKSTIWLVGAYSMGDMDYNAPRIEMTISRLQKPEIQKYQLSQILNKDFTPTEKYKSYLFYNTVQK